MDNELRYCLEQGPTSAKELSRLTGKSASTIYKVLKEGRQDGTIQVQDADPDVDGPVRFFILPEATEAPKAEPVVSPEPQAEKRGRKATGAGKTLSPAIPNQANSRRQNSHGFRSLQIVLDNPGLTTEEYLAKGGRLNDLRWDIAHGNVKVGE